MDTIKYNMITMNKNEQEVDLTNEDLDFIENIEKWNLKSIWADKLKQFKAEWKIIAKNTILKKTRKKALNIRLIEDDIVKIKAIALREGLPYQTYLASEIHKLVS